MGIAKRVAFEGRPLRVDPSVEGSTRPFFGERVDPSAHGPSADPISKVGVKCLDPDTLGVL